MLSKKKLTKKPAKSAVERVKIPQVRLKKQVQNHSVNRLIIGIDEVGRGAFAGPVSVGAYAMHESGLKNFKKIGAFKNLKDSKKLKKADRELWLIKIKDWSEKNNCSYIVSHSSSTLIDKKGLTHAINVALKKCLASLKNKIKFLEHEVIVLLDGGLKAPLEFIHQKTIIKGDEKEHAIALASIAAKVTRDNIMIKLAKKYPEYGFEKHVGYGTKKHGEAIRKHGELPIHRKLFLRTVK